VRQPFYHLTLIQRILGKNVFAWKVQTGCLNYFVNLRNREEVSLVNNEQSGFFNLFFKNINDAIAEGQFLTAQIPQQQTAIREDRKAGQLKRLVLIIIEWFNNRCHQVGA